MSRFDELPNVEPTIYDSTSVMAYKECARKYYYRMVKGYDNPVVYPYFAFGTAYHKFRERLELDFKEAIKDPYSVTAQTDFTQFLQPALLKAVEHWSREAVNIPVDTKWDFLTTERLLKSCAIAFDHWIKEKRSKRIIVLATEQPFIIEMPDGSKTAGRADQIVRDNGRVWGRDFKTSSKTGPFYERTLVPNDQFTRYTFAESQLSGEKVQGQIVEVLYNSKKEGPIINPLRTSRTDFQIELWRKEQVFLVESIKRSRETGVYPMNEKACTYCHFHSVCSLNGEASQVALLTSRYKFKPWDCTKIHNEDE